MSPSPQRPRMEAAEQARAYCEGKLAWREFLDRFSSTKDEQIAELVKLIQHEPDRAGVYTLSTSWLENRERILALINELEKGEMEDRS